MFKGFYRFFYIGFYRFLMETKIEKNIFGGLKDVFLGGKEKQEC